MATFGQKTQIQKFQLSFFLPFSLATTKSTQISWNPYFCSVLTNLKTNIFKIQLKTEKKKNNVCTLFLKKAIFRKLPDNWAPQKHTMTTERKIAWNPYFYSAKMTLAQLITLTWPSEQLWKRPNLAQLITSQHAYIYIYIRITIWARFAFRHPFPPRVWPKNGQKRAFKILNAPFSKVRVYYVKLLYFPCFKHIFLKNNPELQF